MQLVQLPPTPRMQPLVPVHRAALAHVMTSRRQPFVQPQESLRAAVAKLKIGPPTAVRLPHHRRADPHILPLAPPPGLPVSSHLVKGNHHCGPVPYHAGSALFTPPAIRDRAARPPFNPLADHRDADLENPGNGDQRAAFLVHCQGAFLVGGAGALIGGIGDGAASVVAAVIGLFTVGIQLVDMAGGVIRQCYEAEQTATDAYLSAIARYYRVIRERAHYVTDPTGSVT